MKTSRLFPLLFAMLLAGCAQDDWRGNRNQWQVRSRYLAEECRALGNDVRDHLMDNERWEPHGSDRDVWETTVRIREDADRLAGFSDRRPDSIEDGWNAGVLTAPIRRIRDRVGNIRRFFQSENVSRELGKRLASIDALLWTMENETIRDEHRRSRYREVRGTDGRSGAHSRRDYIRYSAPFVGTGRTDSREEAPVRHVASHPGQSEYIRAHSAARRHVTNRHGIRNENLETTSVARQGDRYIVSMESSFGRYEVTVGDAGRTVLKERVRRR